MDDKSYKEGVRDFMLFLAFTEEQDIIDVPSSISVLDQMVFIYENLTDVKKVKVEYPYMKGVLKKFIPLFGEVIKGQG